MEAGDYKPKVNVIEKKGRPRRSFGIAKTKILKDAFLKHTPHMALLSGVSGQVE